MRMPFCFQPKNWVFCLLGVLLYSSSLAQKPDPDLKKSLSELQNELGKMGREVLNHDSLAYRVELNKTFLKRLQTVLSREDSYDFAFDSLVTVSRIFPEDNSFRVFTWCIYEKTSKDHHYFGIIQRKYVRKDGKTEIILHTLNDAIDKADKVESMELTPRQWLGALYYKPRFSDYGVLSYDGKYRKVSGVKGKQKITSIRYYVVLGWNGHDIGSDYKLVDAITFDPDDSSKVIFGAPIFHYGEQAKMRVVFKYSDNSPFNLNLNPVMDGPMRRKRMMIVYDHLSRPRNAREHKLWDYGADGSYDALCWLNRVHQHRKGFFVWLTDVKPWGPEIEGFKASELARIRRDEQKRQKALGLKMPKSKPVKPAPAEDSEPKPAPKPKPKPQPKPEPQPKAKPNQPPPLPPRGPNAPPLPGTNGRKRN